MSEWYFFYSLEYSKNFSYVKIKCPEEELKRNLMKKYLNKKIELYLKLDHL